MDPGPALDEERPLIELGMDSMMALELKNSLQQACGMTLPATFLFAYPTIGGAAVYLNAVISPTQSRVDSEHNSSEFEGIAI